MDSGTKDTLMVRVGDSIRVPLSFEVSRPEAVCGRHGGGVSLSNQETRRSWSVPSSSLLFFNLSHRL
jgi:hypothetical protein